MRRYSPQSQCLEQAKLKAFNDSRLITWQENDAHANQEIWEEGEPVVPRLPSALYPYQVGA